MNRLEKNKHLSAVVKSGIFLVWLFLSLPVYSQVDLRKYPFRSLEGFAFVRAAYLQSMVDLMRSDKYNMEVTFPEEGWTKQSINEKFDLNFNHVTDLSYRIVSKDNRVVVLYSFCPDSLENGFPAICKGWVDTLTSSGRKALRYDKKYAQEKFGTDYAGHFPLDMKRLRKMGGITIRDLDVFSRCEVVWFYHPDNHTLVQLEYYYDPKEYPHPKNPSPAIDIDKCIEETAGMIRFRK